ncbi:YafY family transcriptional regulator [bacterium]|nr:YafY family transcriptional regulator [bacterium]
MKIDRLLAMTVYMINREKVTAPELAEHFEVSVRTIQRDIETLSAAGIPVMSMPGYGGGYGIMKHYKFDRQLVDSNDLFFILTSLENIAGALKNKNVESTLEKIRSLVQSTQAKEIDIRREALHIDFSAMKLGRVSDLYYSLEEAIQRHAPIQFQYTDGSTKRTQRVVEPMTLVFQWTAWYLYGWCRLREDYRLFRLSRFEEIKILDERFERREQSFEQSVAVERLTQSDIPPVLMRFHPSMGVHVKDQFFGAEIKVDDEGYLLVKLAFPESGWLYGMLLSYGEYVEVLEPVHLREILKSSASRIVDIYSKHPT